MVLLDIFNWSGYLLISSVLMIFASIVSLSAARRCAQRNHKLLRMRGGDTVFQCDKSVAYTSKVQSNKRLPDAANKQQTGPKSKRSLMKFASVVVLKDAQMVQDNDKFSCLEKSVEYYL